MTGTKLFRIQQKSMEILDELKKTKKIRPCDLNRVSESWNMYVYLCVDIWNCRQCYGTVIFMA
jgi:hypothetical protein